MPHHQGTVGRWALRVQWPQRAAEKATINMNKICHLVIHGINPCLDDGRRINVICRAGQKTEPDGTFVQNHQLQPVWFGCDPRTECTPFSKHCGHTAGGNIYQSHHHARVQITLTDAAIPLLRASVVHSRTDNVDGGKKYSKFLMGGGNNLP